MTLNRRHLLKTALGGAALCAIPKIAFAKDYPDRPIRFVVPVSPGAGTDTVARIMADNLSRVMKTTWVVENQGGASGQIATQAAARASPDGYNLILGYVSTHGTLPAYRKVPYDPIKDFTHIAMMGGAPNVLVTNMSGPETFEQFLEVTKKNPGKFSYASGGVGSITHLVFEGLKLIADIDVLHVPYRGLGPGFNDMVAGQIQFCMPGLAGATPYIQSGRMRALAVSGAQRAPLLPEVRTFKEIGIPELETVQWLGIMGPKNMPAHITQTLWSAVDHVLAEPEVKKRLAGEGIETMPMTQQAFSKYVSEDLAHWQKIVNSQGLREA
ncbi:MAG TPA: tripartite tricarboxylate transporter substrate binding protein [Advenella sp.]|nr:tripartite tricarboxylate transporter substrate binding protein [Advenella sp.]